MRVLPGLVALGLTAALSVAVVTAASPQPTGLVLNGQPCSVTLASGAQSGTCYGALVTAAPTPTATATPTATPTSTPAPSGWPNASNTGVPAGTVLTPYTGPQTISTAGTVINGVSLTGCLSIPANNVTIENSRIKTGAGCFTALNVSGSGLLVKDTEIDGGNFESGGTGQETYGVFNQPGTLLRVNMHGSTEPINGCHNVTVTDSYIHDVFISSTSHSEDIYCGGTAGGFLTMRHNYLGGGVSGNRGATATVALFGDFSAVANVTLDGNQLNGGGWSLYAGASPGKPYSTQTANVKVTNNRWLRLPEPGAYFANGGYYGPVTAFDSARPGNLWSGNVWDDNGAPIS